MINNAHRRLKEKMIQTQLNERGIKDNRILDAFEKIERHFFVESALAERSYSDSAIPIRHGQTLSQPYIVAKMTEELHLIGGEKVLEIGTGSGFQASILAFLKCHVYSIERHSGLLLEARKIFSKFNLKIQTMIGDGTIGWPTEAPFDRIIITAASPKIPQTLLNQLADDGLLLLPLGEKNVQELTRVSKKNGIIKTQKLLDCKFVPLIGKEGFEK